MKHVTPEELTAMDLDSRRCAAELADARVDIVAYACLVAIMAHGPGYHRRSQDQLEDVAATEAGEGIPVVSSAGALVEAIHHVDSLSLEVSDNLAVGRLDPMRLVDLARDVDTTGADALVLSACVQMPSLPALDAVQSAFAIPIVSAASATVWQILKRLDLDPVVPRAGSLLAAR